jgi:hypothetical protein
MTTSPIGAVRLVVSRMPIELITLVAFAAAIFAVVATGAAILTQFATPSAGLTFAAYGGPAAVAFGLYWVIARRVCKSPARPSAPAPRPHAGAAAER